MSAERSVTELQLIHGVNSCVTVWRWVYGWFERRTIRPPVNSAAEMALFSK